MKKTIIFLCKCFALAFIPISSIFLYFVNTTAQDWTNLGITDAIISIESGKVSLISPDSISLGGIEVSNFDKVIDLVFSKSNYFGVEDLSGDGWYSSTVQISNLAKDNEEIDATNMQVRIENWTIHTIAGKEDLSSLSVPNLVRDFIAFGEGESATILQRSSTTSGIIGKYVVFPNLRFTIPAYQQTWDYSWNITLALDDQNNSEKIIPINLTILRASNFNDDSNLDTTLVIGWQKTESFSWTIVWDSDDIIEAINQVENTSSPIIVVDTKENILSNVESLSGISLDSVKDYDWNIALSKKAILFSDTEETRTPIIFIPLETWRKDKKIILSIPEWTKLSHSWVTIYPPRRINETSSLKSKIIQIWTSDNISIDSAISIPTSQSISFDKFIDICMYNNWNSSVEGRKVYYSNNWTDWNEDTNAINLNIKGDKFCFQTNHLTDFAVVNTEPDDSGESSDTWDGTTDTTVSLNWWAVTVFTPASVDFGQIEVSSSEQTIDIKLESPDYFGIEDLSWQGWYYTTLQIWELKDGDKVLLINEAKIRVENWTVHTIAGQEDTSIFVPTWVGDFVSFDGENPANVLERSSVTDGKIGKYGVLPHLQLTIAKYQKAWSYEGAITFTIIQE